MHMSSNFDELTHLLNAAKAGSLLTWEFNPP